MNESFIHSSLDEAGLSPVEFRVFAHVLRRAGKDGFCYAGVTSMAAVCRVNLKTARRALSKLADYGMVTSDVRPGQATVHKPTTPETWRLPLPKQYPSQTDTGVSKREEGAPNPIPGHPSQTDTAPPSQTDTPEVYPPKFLPEVSPLKAGGSAPSFGKGKEGKKLFPKEYDNLIAGAWAEIKRLRQSSGNESVIAELKDKIHQWKSAKLGVDLPKSATTGPVSQSGGMGTPHELKARQLGDVMPSSDIPSATPPKITRKSSFTIEAVLALAARLKISESFARDWFQEYRNDPVIEYKSWETLLENRWHHSKEAMR